MSKQERVPVPAPAAILFAAVAVLACITNGYPLINSDGDLARHIRVGGYMLDAHAIPKVDLFSHTMLGQPFVPYEWLSEVMFAAAHRAGGIPGVVVLSALLMATMGALIYWFLTRRGVDPLLSALTTFAAVVLTSLHWLARPHLFTMVAAAALIIVLDGKGTRNLILGALLFGLWANLHGGFTYGLIMIGVFIAGDALESQLSQEREAARERLRYHSILLAVALTATLLNPAFFHLHVHVLDYLQNKYLVDHTNEYMSPNFHHTGVKLFLAALVAVIALLARGTRRLRISTLLVLLVNVAFALYSSRNIPLFAITVLPLLAVHFDASWRSIGRVKRVRSAVALGEDRGMAWPFILLTTLILAGVALNNGKLLGESLTPTSFSEKEFPVKAVQRARAAGLKGRIFNEFTWGGYLLYAWPEQRVFIDGQTDFYGADLTRTHSQINNLDPGWRARLDEYHIGILILTSKSKLAAEVVRDPSWRVWYHDKTATIIVRQPGTT